MLILLKSLLSQYGNKISISRASLVFTPLKPPVSVFSKISTMEEDVGGAIIISERSLCMQSLNELAKLHFLGL